MANVVLVRLKGRRSHGPGDLTQVVNAALVDPGGELADGLAFSMHGVCAVAGFLFFEERTVFFNGRSQ